MAWNGRQGELSYGALRRGLVGYVRARNGMAGKMRSGRARRA